MQDSTTDFRERKNVMQGRRSQGAQGTGPPVIS